MLLRRAEYGVWGPEAPRDIAGVQKLMREGRARGWFRSASYYSPDLGGVAVPVVLGDRIYSVTVAGPLTRNGPFSFALIVTSAMRKLLLEWN